MNSPENVNTNGIILEENNTAVTEKQILENEIGNEIHENVKQSEKLDEIINEGIGKVNIVDVLHVEEKIRSRSVSEVEIDNKQRDEAVIISPTGE